MNDELTRRISDALDAPGGIEADEDLRAQIESDAAATAYAQDLESIGAALGALSTRASEPDWRAMLGRIEARLDDDLEDIGDVTAPPELEDAEGQAPAVPVKATAPAVAMRAESNVVDLAAHRRQRALFATIGGLAAAAAVGLGIMAGLSLERDAEPVAAAGVMQAASEAAPASPAPAQMAVSDVMGDVEAPGSSEESLPEADMVAGGEAPSAAPSVMATAPAEARADLDRPDMQPMPGRRASGGSSRGAAGTDDGLHALGRSHGPGQGAGGMGGPQTPDRVEVVNALNSVQAEIVACMGDTRSVARVFVRVNGSTGTVGAVRVSPPFSGAEAACMVRVIGGVQMPRSASTYEIEHAYRPERVAGGTLGRPAAAARARRRQSSATPAQERVLPSADVDRAF